MVTKMKEVISSLNLDPGKREDLVKFADLIANGQIPVPRKLRGPVVSRKMGFYWSKSEAYIAKNKFRVDLRFTTEWSFQQFVPGQYILEADDEFIGSSYSDLFSVGKCVILSMAGGTFSGVVEDLHKK